MIKAQNTFRGEKIFKKVVFESFEFQKSVKK
jgi:hypothetical protein